MVEGCARIGDAQNALAVFDEITSCLDPKIFQYSPSYRIFGACMEH